MVKKEVLHALTVLGNKFAKERSHAAAAHESAADEDEERVEDESEIKAADVFTKTQLKALDHLTADARRDLMGVIRYVEKVTQRKAKDLEDASPEDKKKMELMEGRVIRQASERLKRHVLRSLHTVKMTKAFLKTQSMAERNHFLRSIITQTEKTLEHDARAEKRLAAGLTLDSPMPKIGKDLNVDEDDEDVTGSDGDENGSGSGSSADSAGDAGSSDGDEDGDVSIHATPFKTAPVSAEPAKAKKKHHARHRSHAATHHASEHVKKPTGEQNSLMTPEGQAAIIKKIVQEATENIKAFVSKDVAAGIHRLEAMHTGAPAPATEKDAAAVAHEAAASLPKSSGSKDPMDAVVDEVTEYASSKTDAIGKELMAAVGTDLPKSAKLKAILPKVIRDLVTKFKADVAQARKTANDGKVKLARSPARFQRMFRSTFLNKAKARIDSDFAQAKRHAFVQLGLAQGGSHEALEDEADLLLAVSPRNVRIVHSTADEDEDGDEDEDEDEDEEEDRFEPGSAEEHLHQVLFALLSHMHDSATGAVAASNKVSKHVLMMAEDALADAADHSHDHATSVELKQASARIASYVDHVDAAMEAVLAKRVPTVDKLERILDQLEDELREHFVADAHLEVEHSLAKYHGSPPTPPTEGGDHLFVSHA